MRQLSRFIHVSDLHLTRYDPLNGKPVFTGARTLWNTAYSGFWGHSFDSQIALEDFFVDQQRHHGPAELILTGDLTSIGHPDEFAHARDYIESSVRPTQAAPYGLQAGSCRLKIPGNHDHWPGAYWPHGRSHGLPVHFPHLPTVLIHDVPAGPYRLRFILIDTDADVTDYSYERIRALGSFKSQLRLAAAELKRHPFEPNEVRVLLLHHSLRHRGWTLQITDATRKELERFLLAEHIQVMLCGHTHLTDLHVHRLTAANKSLDVLEACCGSTTQDTDPPYQVRRLFGIPLPASFPPNALLTHELHDLDGKTLVWAAQAHELGAGTTTFVPAGQPVMHRIVSGP